MITLMSSTHPPFSTSSTSQIRPHPFIVSISARLPPPSQPALGPDAQFITRCKLKAGRIKRREKHFLALKGNGTFRFERNQFFSCSCGADTLLSQFLSPSFSPWLKGICCRWLKMLCTCTYMYIQRASQDSVFFVCIYFCVYIYFCDVDVNAI